MLPLRVTMLTAPTLVMPVERSKLAEDSWNSSTTSCEKFIPVLPSIELRTLPPSTVIAVLLESPPRIDTEKSELYCEVEPGLARDARLEERELQEAAAVERQLLDLLPRDHAA